MVNLTKTNFSVVSEADSQIVYRPIEINILVNNKLSSFVASIRLTDYITLYVDSTEQLAQQ